MAPVARKQSSEPGGAAPSANAGEIDWLSACRRMVAAQRELFAEQRGIAARTVYAGIGEGGDRTLAIDRQCEDIVFAELERLHAEGHQFKAISEERGEVAFGDSGSPVSVIVDPLDGSLNARRMLPSHSLSIAIASGATMADVELGYVYDFGASEEYFAVRGQGATLDGRELRAEGPGFGLEVVGIESAKPERTLPLLEALAGKAYRIRADRLDRDLPLLRGRRPVRRHADRPCLPLRRRGRRPADRARSRRRGRLRRRGPGGQPGPRRPLPRRGGPRRESCWPPCSRPRSAPSRRSHGA